MLLALSGENGRPLREGRCCERTRGLRGARARLPRRSAAHCSREPASGPEQDHGTSGWLCAGRGVTARQRRARPGACKATSRQHCSPTRAVPRCARSASSCVRAQLRLCARRRGAGMRGASAPSGAAVSASACFAASRSLNFRGKQSRAPLQRHSTQAIQQLQVICSTAGAGRRAVLGTESVREALARNSRARASKAKPRRDPGASSATHPRRSTMHRGNSVAHRPRSTGSRNSVHKAHVYRQPRAHLTCAMCEKCTRSTAVS